MQVSLRPEFYAVQLGFEQVIGYVDPVYEQVEKAAGMALMVIWNKYAAAFALAAFFPVMAFLIPISILALTIGLPIFIPIAIGTFILCAVNAMLIGGILAISPPGRKKIIEPTIEAIVSKPSGRKILYAEGSRPTPMEICQDFAPKTPTSQLFMCLFMDLICGNLSYLVPLLGESFDFIWGPCQCILMGAMFDKTMPNAKWVGLMEEVLPMTDILPSATLTWLRANPDYFAHYVDRVKLKPSNKVTELREDDEDKKLM